jgi:1-acyl-sn-glycerol-3-phosphate acyltransferase
MPEYAWNALRIASRQYMKGRVNLSVEGEEYLPTAGPCIIAARHYHHLLDGAVVISVVPHPVHILVGLDWIRNPALRVLMHRLCNAAGWPIVYRRTNSSPIDELTARRALRTAYRESISLLQRGHSLLVFPEGYPNIDPGYTLKTEPEQFLPFQPGFAQIAASAKRMGIDAPIIPAGFSYRKEAVWDITLRFGAPVSMDKFPSQDAAVSHVESTVKALSTPSR